MSDIAFASNYTNLFMIDITPSAASPTWERIGAGINSVSWNGNEVVAQDPYYDGDGQSSSEVTGGQMVGTFAGHRKYGDPAQDYIAGLANQYGSKRHTSFKRIAPDGTVMEGDVTIVNINPGGGDPNAKSDFGFELHYHRAPTVTPGTAEDFPSAISATAVSVAAGATATISPTITPSGASPAVVYAVEDDTVATVDASGKVTGVAAGETNVSIKSAALPSVKATVKVTVTSA